MAKEAKGSNSRTTTDTVAAAAGEPGAAITPFIGSVVADLASTSNAAGEQKTEADTPAPAPVAYVVYPGPYPQVIYRDVPRSIDGKAVLVDEVFDRGQVTPRVPEVATLLVDRKLIRYAKAEELKAYLEASAPAGDQAQKEAKEPAAGESGQTID